VTVGQAIKALRQAIGQESKHWHMIQG
jgi:hypothetical protein